MAVTPREDILEALPFQAHDRIDRLFERVHLLVFARLRLAGTFFNKEYPNSERVNLSVMPDWRRSYQAFYSFGLDLGTAD